MKRRTILDAAAIFTMAIFGSATLCAQADEFAPGYNPGTTTTVTNVTGTITQLNYGNDGTVDGFLIGTNILLSFPRPPAGGIGTLGAAGNSVTYSGTATTNSAGFESVRVSSFTNNTTKATYTPPTTAPTPVTYGPTTGTVKQVNYDAQGNISGFLFTPTGASAPILVNTGFEASATLKPLLTTGVAVTVNGISEIANPAACTSSGALAVVQATSLTIGSQTIVITGGGGGGGRGGPPHR